jgi:hypothetical protein
MDRRDDAYYGARPGTPMHPDRMKWLKKESLFYVEVRLLIRFHEMPRSRRCRTRMYWDEYADSRANASWTDMSPVMGCTYHAIGCPACLSHRQATDVVGEEIMCPRKTNPDSEEKCFWGEDGINGGLCADCFIQAEFGCGWGGHECTACIVDNHHSEEIAQHCADCGPCIAMHDNDEEGGHCRQVCPYNCGVCG